MSRVLVTGAAGFIGSHLVRALLERGHEVAALARPASSMHRLGQVRADVRLVVGDVRDPPSVVSALHGWRPEACAHLAWYAEPRTYLDSHENLSALAASLDFLSHLLDSGCQRLLVTGTCAEYRASERPLREDSPLGPKTLYAASKLALRTVLEQLAAASDARLAWARIFHLYGPGENELRLVPSVIRALLAGQEFAATAGTQVRDYLHVADVALALCRLIEVEADGPVNVSSGEPISVRRLLQEIARIIGKPHLLRLGERKSRDSWDPPYLCGENRRLRHEAGWQRRHELAEGLSETVGWWRARGTPRC